MKTSRLRPGDLIRNPNSLKRAVLRVEAVDERYVRCTCDAVAGMDGPNDPGRVTVPLWDAQHRYERVGLRTAPREVVPIKRHA